MKFILKLAEYSWQKVILIAIVAAAGYYFLQFDDGSSLEMVRQQRLQEMEREQDLLNKTKTAMRDLERFKEELNNQQAQVKEVLSFLPKQMNMGELLSAIQDRANQAGLRVLKTDPKDEVARIEFYEAMRIELELAGTFNQIATFLSLLSKLPRLVTLDKISLITTTKDGETPKIAFGATVVGYRFVDEPKPAPSQDVQSVQ